MTTPPSATIDPDAAARGVRAATRPPVDRTLWALMIAFFASGFAALLCQIVWQRMLGLFAGSDTVSASLVVGAFLAGLGLGSILGARVADRLSPVAALAGFALAETGVAAFALASKPFLYDFLATGLAGTIDAPAAIFALCFAGLVVPTTLMGVSLPLLSRTVATSLGDVAERVGNLYGLNTLGAGLGALVGGWWLVGGIGFVGALGVAAALDVFAALVALTLLPSLRDRAARVAPARDAPGDAAPRGGLVPWAALVFVSGYVIVALEIVWVRVLGQIGMFHAYLFPTVLGVFLLADGLGIAVGARIVRRVTDPRPAFFVTQGGGFVLAAALLLVAWWAVPAWPMVELLSVDAERLNLKPFAAMLGVTLVVVGPPAFVIGMTFPFVQRAVQHDLSQVGARVGWVQLANIAGNAAGAVITGLLTLHWLGTAGTMKFLAVLSLLLMAGWLCRRAGRRLPEIAIAVACVAAFAAFPGNERFWSRLHLERAGHVVGWAEDRSGVAFFRGERSPDGRVGGPFFIQGFAQGSLPFLPIHQFLGAVGPLVHPDARDVLAIGVGSGGTPWAAGVLPGTRVHAIELVAPVLSVHRDIAASAPDGPSARMLADPRWRMTYGDGRRLLARDTTRFDVIEADALLPQGSLSGQIYSREFLQAARRRLAPGGLYVQWVPTCRAVDTIRSVFPHAALLLPGRVMIGSDSPIPVSPEALARRFAEPAVRAHLALGEPGPTDYASFARRVLVWRGDGSGEGASLTDLRPRDEFYRNNRRWLVEGDSEAARRATGPAIVDMTPGVPGRPEPPPVPGCDGFVAPG
ncbi:MAG TPA: fused MFS/spermidine synthase [Burkholderiaceae bacterium]|nr:fused MFS/spermidine synthase [Burkholderiaceae bacterium]